MASRKDVPNAKRTKPDVSEASSSNSIEKNNVPKRKIALITGITGQVRYHGSS